MKLVLVNAPGITTLPALTPATGDISANTYLKVTAPATVNASITVVVTSDDTMKVDNMAVCTKITFSIVGTIGVSPNQKDFSDSITINGSTSNTTINNQPIILMGDNGTGGQGCTAEVISCGQTSTSME